MRRDPGLGHLLEVALPSAVPPPGAEERVLERIRAAPRSSVVARPSAARGGLGWAVAAIVILVAGFRFVVGVPWYTPSAGSSRSVAIGANDQLLLLEHGVRVLARSGADMDLVELADHSECRLQVGVVLVHVPEGSPRRFEVLTPSSRVVVTGTIFSVGTDAGATRVTVWDGHVQVLQGDVRTSLGAGQHWPPASAAAVATEADFELLGAAERLRAGALLPPLASYRDAGRQDPAQQAEPAPSAQPRARTLFSQAGALERAGQLRRAAAVYERAAAADATDAEAASFAAARLYNGMANHRAVQRVLLAHRARYVDGGAYGRAADVLLLRTYVAQGNAVQVEREAERFILHHPLDPRASQFRDARALGWAKRGRCGEAQRELSLLSVAAAAEVARACVQSSDEPRRFQKMRR